MVFQGLDAAAGARRSGARSSTGWPASPQDFAIDFAPLKIVATPARDFWDARRSSSALPGFVARRRPPGRAGGQRVLGRATRGRRARSCTATGRRGCPASLLRRTPASALADALFAASRHWGVALHFNKGLAGAPAEVIAAARDTAMNPAVLDAFALVISARRGPAGLSRHRRPRARPRAARATTPHAIDRAMGELRKLAAERRLVRVGERLLRGRLAARRSGARTTRGCWR